MSLSAFFVAERRADAQTIDFSSCPAFCMIDNGDTFSENGFTLTGTSGSGGSINGLVPDPALVLGGQVIRLTRDGGGLFDFLSFDLEFRSSLDALGTFVVTSSNGGVQNVSPLGTYNLSGPTWEGLSWVDFTVVTGEFFSDNNTIDNLVMAAADAAPGFSKSFAPAIVAAGGSSTLTFSVDNSTAGSAATALAFTDNFPAGLVVATPANASTTCTGGTLTAVVGSGTVTYMGGTVASGTTCTLSVDATAAVDGVYVNTTGDLTSSLGNSGTATATLTVTTPVPVLPSSWLLALTALLMLGGAAWMLRRRATTAGA